MASTKQTAGGTASDSGGHSTHLYRTLSLWNLIVIGMVIVQPTAPMGIYGVINNKAHGHVVTTIMIAMVAMLLTAISYGRMARAYERRFSSRPAVLARAGRFRKIPFARVSSGWIWQLLQRLPRLTAETPRSSLPRPLSPQIGRL